MKKAEYPRIGLPGRPWENPPVGARHASPYTRKPHSKSINQRNQGSDNETKINPQSSQIFVEFWPTEA
ncbi:MAG: hypothetical protein HQK56_18785 [Deltaproteobacteria bacterium]|nr:hypothetical protein [Deltaproteobacteria bacterium]